MILAKFYQFAKTLHVFVNAILGQFLCAKLTVRNFACAKELTFRRSAPSGPLKPPYYNSFCNCHTIVRIAYYLLGVLEVKHV